MIDFTNSKRIAGRAYNGANGNKIAVEYCGDIYMLKFPPSTEGRRTELSYANSCISEHIASSIFNMLGLKAQDTLLGTYTVKGKEKIVCACKDFTAGGKRLLDFCSIKNTVLESDSNGSGTELIDVLEAIDKQEFVPSDMLKDYFWNMFVIDALLGNFDRHNGNWGFLYDDANENAEIAPVFDCGSCLLPQADDKVMRLVIENEDELNARVFRFPTSALQIEKRKINYADYLSKEYNGDVGNAIKRVVSRINMEEIEEFINNVEGISNLQKDFYIKYINARYDLLITPAYKKVMLL